MKSQLVVHQLLEGLKEPVIQITGNRVGQYITRPVDHLYLANHFPRFSALVCIDRIRMYKHLGNLLPTCSLIFYLDLAHISYRGSSLEQTQPEKTSRYVAAC